MNDTTDTTTETTSVPAPEVAAAPATPTAPSALTLIHQGVAYSVRSPIEIAQAFSGWLFASAVEVFVANKATMTPEEYLTEATALWFEIRNGAYDMGSNVVREAVTLPRGMLAFVSCTLGCSQDVAARLLVERTEDVRALLAQPIAEIQSK